MTCAWVEIRKFAANEDEKNHCEKKKSSSNRFQD